MQFEFVWQVAKKEKRKKKNVRKNGALRKKIDMDKTQHFFFRVTVMQIHVMAI